jgi:hypothetical protein
VKAYGRLRIPIFAAGLDITICDLQFSSSSLFSWNMKSTGNRSGILDTA